MGFSTGKKLLVTKRNMRSGSGALSTWGTNLSWGGLDLAILEYAAYACRLVPHVDKAPLPLRILRLVTSNFLPVENPTHPTAHAPERASVYILGQFRTSK